MVVLAQARYKIIVNFFGHLPFWCCLHFGVPFLMPWFVLGDTFCFKSWLWVTIFMGVIGRVLFDEYKATFVRLNSKLEQSFATKSTLRAIRGLAWMNVEKWKRLYPETLFLFKMWYNNSDVFYSKIYKICNFSVVWKDVYFAQNKKKCSRRNSSRRVENDETHKIIFRAGSPVLKNQSLMYFTAKFTKYVIFLLCKKTFILPK